MNFTIFGLEITIRKMSLPVTPDNPVIPISDVLEMALAQSDEKDASDIAYIKMNNLFLRIQRRGWITLRDRLELENLLAETYPPKEETMRNWWFSEFAKLPGWFEV